MRSVLHLPAYAPGQRIGLYGGSFNPAHAGHLHVSRTALKRLRLDRLWWLVTPGNPLKDQTGLPSLGDRLAGGARMARDPRIAVTGFEAALGSPPYTVETLRVLKARCPGLRFVWIMGADSLANLHHWQQWRTIADLMPIAVIDRPGWTMRALSSRAALALARYRLPAHAAAILADCRPPAWVFLHGRRSTLSSTALRQHLRE